MNDERRIPRISAVICTHNRCKLLKSAILSLHEQTILTDEYEIIVVNNASTDDTATLLKNMKEEVSNLTIVFESEIGLSVARNNALQIARGRYIAFLDDDAIAANDWLEKIVLCFEQQSDAVVMVGGPVVPIWEVTPPPWLTIRMKDSLAIVDWSETKHTLRDNEWLVGTNMAFRKDCFKYIAGFDHHLGRQSQSLLSMEEEYLRLRLLTEGRTAYYDPDIMVSHFIPRERLKRRWFLRRFYYQGVSEAKFRLLESKVSGTFLRKSSILKSYFLKSLNTTRAIVQAQKHESRSEREKCSFFDSICILVKSAGFLITLFKMPYDISSL